MEREIGNVFDYNGVRLKTVNAPFCWDCYFKIFFPVFRQATHKGYRALRVFIAR